MLGERVVVVVVMMVLRTESHSIWLEPPSRASLGLIKPHCHLPKVSIES